MSTKIGVFDSGIGGVTVLKELVKVLPKLHYSYYSDSANNPYGDKTDEEICIISDKIVESFIKDGCKAVVIACNTASAKAAKYLRKKYSIPIIAIEPAYKMVHDLAYDKSTIVMATKGTIESEKFHQLYDKYNNNKTDLLACKGLADVIEEGNGEKIKKYLEKNLSEYKGKVENVVLGCTHYPLIQNEIKEVLGDVEFFNGAHSLAQHLKEILITENLLEENEDGKIEFYDSSNSEYKKDRFFMYLKSDKFNLL